MRKNMIIIAMAIVILFSGCTIPEDLPYITAIAAGTYYAVALTKSGEVVFWGYDPDGDLYVPPYVNKPLKQIASHYYHIIAVQEDGSVLGWRRAEFSEDIQRGGELTNVVSVSTGRGLSLALKNDGTVGVLGGYSYWLAEYAMQLKDIKCVAAGFFAGGAVKEDGTLYIWGKDVGEIYKNDKLDKLILYESKD